MRKLLLLVLLSAVYCRSVPDVQNENLPDRVTGCSTLTGWNRQDCLNKQNERWERVENSTPERTYEPEKSVQVTWTHAKHYYRVCRADLCHEEILIEEDPTLTYYLVHYGAIIFFSFLGGAAAAGSAGH